MIETRSRYVIRKTKSTFAWLAIAGVGVLVSVAIAVWIGRGLS